MYTTTERNDDVITTKETSIELAPCSSLFVLKKSEFDSKKNIFHILKRSEGDKSTEFLVQKE